ncbi:hypothetical protein LB505_009605 [Fusarium chuoi]|nr:hypothetical protein LB505_009605 [Fusarium chuoi]
MSSPGDGTRTTVGTDAKSGFQEVSTDFMTGRKRCVEPPICSDLDGGATLQFLNRPWDSLVAFELIDFDLNRQWDAEGTIYLPTTKQLTWLLDETDIHVLFINATMILLYKPHH